MRHILATIRKDRLYLLLLIFVILLNVVSAMPAKVMAKTRTEVQKVDAGTKAARISETEIYDRQKKMEKFFNENPSVAMTFGLSALLFMAVFSLGVVIDAIFAASILRGRQPDISTYRPGYIKWNLWDVAKVGILFLFFGYMVIMTESALARLFPILKNTNFRIVLNSSVLDLLIIVFILYFTVGQYNVPLGFLGISFKNFFRNVSYGIVGYIAIVPILVALLAITFAIMNIFRYVPQEQVVVKLFLKEKNTNLLLYTSIFASIVGPIIEELFFRGFMYNAFKKYTGVFVAMLITASTFAALHAHAAGFLPIMALGMLLAYMYEKTGTLVSSITIHTIHNLSMVLLVFMIKQLGV